MSDKTREIHVGPVVIGAGAPVAVQSMLSCPTTDVHACVSQINELADAGCEIIRIAIPSKAALPAFHEICEESTLPVVADIHFDYKLAIEAARGGAAKLRINPGNISKSGTWSETDAVIDAAGEAGIPIRIGVNAGSLEEDIANRKDMNLSQKLVESANTYARHFDERGFHDVAISAKTHDVRSTVDTYRMLARELPDVPLHLGVTEAGTARQGTIKSAAAMGALLLDGIGDTIRVSL
ncbi:MAG: flavodoxin-dependent (E)-4-hydroxy-3-methylbut-2-enyl-diphosphate synthase, partial [Coriobacteriales bacterium]|nr:flavodoxin-dependent (E)-4-hydroxy-3-methylbut-2-enyl-diphosphate synthase [Coriobacteriales bacterium]